MSRKTQQQTRRKPSRSRSGRKKDAVLVFTATNYRLLGIGLVLITIGYVLMRWENEVDGFISLYIAPLIILGGYLEIIYAIMKRPVAAEKDAATKTPATTE